MNILLIGSGGREHAMAWKVAESPRLSQMFALPGNPGIGQLATLVPIPMEDHPAVIRFCKENRIELVLVGPEGPLAEGIVDDLEAAGLHCFGPRKAAARIESSKVFSKDFMQRHGIPTAGYATFSDRLAALDYLDSKDDPVVIKASGLAAGKGVILPGTKEEARATLKEIMSDGIFGEAGNEVVIEERMSGVEVSLMAFCDGTTVRPMLPAQDHKRLLDGDQGPNTGGMGAYAPAQVLTEALLEEAVEKILKPAIRGLKEEGTPFVGVLYAGLMLTPNGMRVLEFNCRFGDPETQAVLPLLETDLVEIALACVEGRLAELHIHWKKAACACVVLASRGYPDQPEKGKRITFEELPGNMACFQAGTRSDGDAILTWGGRVLGLTAWAETIESAVEQVYNNIDKVRFKGRKYRTDIANQALKRTKPGLSYQGSGVSIDAGNKAVELMKSAVRATYTPAVLAGIGSFGGLLDASSLKEMHHPVLVASTDGVGTKVKLAAASGRYRVIGQDIVNHCINDILVQGGKPLLFLDYFATARLNPVQTAEVVTGMAEACQAAGMALLGGETAEMPGVYLPGEFDVAGTIVGVLEKEQILPHSGQLKAGNVLIGLRSSGPHTNGYSLIRRVFVDTPLETVFPELGISLADALLKPHRSYLALVTPILGEILALAHITGGGFIENIPRILPNNLDAVIHTGSWALPVLWSLIQARGRIETREMYRVFNMGIGMVVIVDQGRAVEIQRSIPEETYLIGELVNGSGRVQLE
jgi:phosphoribosylamine--glycine ligase/phosphoribosylformylglycinamidine cyclo-ligase